MLAVQMSPPIATLPAYMSGTPGHKTDAASTSKRPKLSLQTNSLSTALGGLSRGRVGNGSTHATATPTTSNTYANTWDLTFRPSPSSRTASPRPFAIPRTVTPEQAYNVVLPFGVKSILKNSPLPIDSRRGSVSVSPREPRRRVLFPQAKKVTFKRNLEDVIETSKYTAKHSDLLSSSDDDESSVSSDGSQDSPERLVNPESSHQSSPPPSKRRRRRGDSGARVSSGSSSEHTEDDDPTGFAVTPRADRKRRRWEWTLTTAARASSPPATGSPPADKTGANQERCATSDGADQGPTDIADQQTRSQK